MSSNIHYKSNAIVDYYSQHRKSWKELYPSEQESISWLASRMPSPWRVLDVGCACGGLALALDEKVELSEYCGVDLHAEAIEWARQNIHTGAEARFVAGDIIQWPEERTYDLVVSLSCADWNIETGPIIQAAWKRVRPGGFFLISLRLTEKDGINNVNASYQYANFAGQCEGEKANYVVFNIFEALELVNSLQPKLVYGYGYWGKPSASAVTPYEKLVFTVLAIQKAQSGDNSETEMELRLPLSLLLSSKNNVRDGSR